MSPLPPNANPPLDEVAIQTLVYRFYEVVRQDPLLGPIFETRLVDRWDAHLNRMTDFWSTVLLGTGRFQGDPMGAHLAIPGLSPVHFERWIELFADTATGCLPSHQAIDIVTRSRRMRAAIERRLDDASATFLDRRSLT